MHTIATLGPIGRVPRLPGTLGSAVGLGIFWLLGANPRAQAAALAVAAALGFWSAGKTAAAIGMRDPSAIIIDEVAGMMLALFLLPVRLDFYLAGFLLFRLLDIWKPWLIRKVERLPGSLGIMADDLLAGLVVNLCLQAALRFW